MTDALARLRADVTRDDVMRAMQEYDRLGAEQFYAAHKTIEHKPIEHKPRP